jgi:DNA-binding IclR family transcriptional regulator
MFRVRREGWVSRRQQARSRFAAIFGNQGSSTPRILKGLERRGMLERSKKNAVRPRFNLRNLR